ncbi:SCO2584 family spore wall biosynthesis protein [Kitasatospora sp. McL0602]|uniref:SCO2584 family spore wall biosynthesis protein n=1 Tax=Kitasatospora sp. McL0602 TaxID=3439530 RepID=UPI003F88A61E
MAEDVGGSPYSGGADHGGADDEFSSVVFDEAFVRSAAVHEPSARERQLAAAEARFEPDTVAPGRGLEPDGLPLELRPHPGGLDDDHLYPDPFTGPGRAARAQRRASLRRAGWGRAARYEAARRVGGRHVAQQRWHRPVAWVLAVVMGASLIAVAVAAIYRSTGGGGSDAPPRPEPAASSSGAAQPKPAVLLPG